MKNQKTSKQIKIDNILGLISGDVKPTEIAPRMILRVDLEGNKTFTINGKLVDEDYFHIELAKWPWWNDNFQTFGLPDDNVEYYY